MKLTRDKLGLFPLSALVNTSGVRHIWSTVLANLSTDPPQSINDVIGRKSCDL